MSEKKADSEAVIVHSSPVNPLQPMSKKRKGATLEAPKRKKKKTKAKMVVKSDYQCLQAIEKKMCFDIYTSYTKIDLTDGYIGPVGAKLIGDALKSAGLVVKLSLAGNHLPSKHIAPVLASLPKLVMLESMDLSRNKLSDVDAKLIWEFMATSQTLTRLDLSNNEITLNGEWVSEPLKKSNIGHIFLNNNPIGDNGVSFLAAGLTQNDCLEMLELKGTKITSLVDIASLLQSNTTLKCISLSGSLIKRGYDSLRQALKSNKTLVELNLQDVGLTLANLSTIINTLHENTTLRFMRVAKNGLPAELFKAFRQLLWTRRELRIVNKIADESEMAYNMCTEKEDEEAYESQEEEDCTSSLCEWPDYARLKPQQFEDATEILSLYPEVRIDVIVQKELDTRSMKAFYSTAMDKLNTRIYALMAESYIKNTVLADMAYPLQDKETLLTELEEKKQELKLQMQEARREFNECQIEYLKKKIPAVLTEDILSAAKLNAGLVEARQESATLQFEEQQQKMQQPLVEWKAADVTMLLRELGIGQYYDKFASNEISGGVLVNLNTLDLMQDLGMEWKDAKKIQKAILLLNHRRSIYENPPGVFSWDTDATCQWLAKVGFDQYKEVFKKHRVTGQELLLINKYDLSSVFKIESLKDKVSLEQAIKVLLSTDEPSWKRDPSIVVKQQSLKQEKDEPDP